jgi:hypothetical protein
LIVPKTKRFNNYPLALDNKGITANQLSDYGKNLLGDDSCTETKKISLVLTDNKRCTIHTKSNVLPQT